MQAGKITTAAQQIAALIDYGFSDGQIAQSIGVSESKLQDWRSGKKIPTGAEKHLLLIFSRYPQYMQEALDLEGVEVE